jgi:hypothetical protein
MCAIHRPAAHRSASAPALGAPQRIQRRTELTQPKQIFRPGEERCGDIHRSQSVLRIHPSVFGAQGEEPRLRAAVSYGCSGWMRVAAAPGTFLQAKSPDLR